MIFLMLSHDKPELQLNILKLRRKYFIKILFLIFLLIKTLMKEEKYRWVIKSVEMFGNAANLQKLLLNAFHRVFQAGGNFLHIFLQPQNWFLYLKLSATEDWDKRR